MTYRFLDHTADVAVEIEHAILNVLFEEAALALMETQADLKTVGEKKEFRIHLEAENEEKLLFAFLEELIFLKDSEYVLMSKFNVNIEGNTLDCIAYGEEINQETMRLDKDVKAATYHDFILEKRDKWYAHFILDI